MIYNVESQEEILRKRFRPGTRIEFIKSPAIKDIPQGSRGTIKKYNEDGSIAVHWDNGRDTTLIPNVDQFKQLNIDAKIQEAEAVRSANIAKKAKQKSRAKQHTVDSAKEY